MLSRTETLIVVGLVVQVIVALITVLVAFLAARWGAQQGLEQAQQERLFERRIEWYTQTVHTLERFRIRCRTLRPLIHQLPADALRLPRTNAWNTVAQMTEFNAVAEEVMLCLAEGELHASPASVTRMRALSAAFDQQLRPHITTLEQVQGRRNVLDWVLLWRPFRDLQAITTIGTDVLERLERLALETELALAQEGRRALKREDVPPWETSTPNDYKTR